MFKIHRKSPRVLFSLTSPRIIEKWEGIVPGELTVSSENESANGKHKCAVLFRLFFFFNSFLFTLFWLFYSFFFCRLNVHIFFLQNVSIHLYDAKHSIVVSHEFFFFLDRTHPCEALYSSQSRVFFLDRTHPESIICAAMISKTVYGSTFIQRFPEILTSEYEIFSFELSKYHTVCPK